VAPQALYEIDIAGHRRACGTGTYSMRRPDESNGISPARLFLGSGQLLKPDQFIHTPDWPLEQVAVIDRNILRIALWVQG
jgi:hypothetical protein